MIFLCFTYLLLDNRLLQNLAPWEEKKKHLSLSFSGIWEWLSWVILASSLFLHCSQAMGPVSFKGSAGGESIPKPATKVVWQSSVPLWLLVRYFSSSLHESIHELLEYPHRIAASPRLSDWGGGVKKYVL